MKTNQNDVNAMTKTLPQKAFNIQGKDWVKVLGGVHVGKWSQWKLFLTI